MLTFIFVYLMSCSSPKLNIVKTGENIREIAIRNAIEDFSNSCKLRKESSSFTVRFEDSFFKLAFDLESPLINQVNSSDDLILVKISVNTIDIDCSDECCNRYLYTKETTIGSKGKLPSRHIEKDGKLFFWWDNDYPLTEEMLALLWKYDLLCDDTEGLIHFPTFTIDEDQKGAHYYFCKEDLSNYKRVVTNVAPGYYKVPKLICK